MGVCGAFGDYGRSQSIWEHQSLGTGQCNKCDVALFFLFAWFKLYVNLMKADALNYSCSHTVLQKLLKHLATRAATSARAHRPIYNISRVSCSKCLLISTCKLFVYSATWPGPTNSKVIFTFLFFFHKFLRTRFLAFEMNQAIFD